MRAKYNESCYIPESCTSLLGNAHVHSYIQLAVHTCMVTVMCGSRNKLQHVMALLDRILHSDQESVPE